MISAVPARVRNIAGKLAFMAAPFVAMGAMYYALFHGIVPPLLLIVMVGVFVASCWRLKISSGRLENYRPIFGGLAGICVLLLLDAQPIQDRIMLVAVGLLLLGLALEREDA